MPILPHLAGSKSCGRVQNIAFPPKSWLEIENFILWVRIFGRFLTCGRVRFFHIKNYNNQNKFFFHSSYIYVYIYFFICILFLTIIFDPHWFVSGLSTAMHVKKPGRNKVTTVICFAFIVRHGERQLAPFVLFRGGQKPRGGIPDVSRAPLIYINVFQ
jgi:hypothetical protein